MLTKKQKAALIIHLLQNSRKKRKCWAKKWLMRRNNSSHMVLLKELSVEEPLDYKNYLRMSEESFNYLLNIIAPKIAKQWTVLRDPITPEEKLTATLRFLATGCTYEELKFSTRISAQALGKIIPLVCQSIYDSLKHEYLKVCILN